MFLSYATQKSTGFVFFSPVIELAPLVVNDANGDLLYTIHVDAYDNGTVGGCSRSYPNLPTLSEVRTGDTYSLFFVYVVEPDGKTFSPVALKSFEISLLLSNPGFFDCYDSRDSGWQLCNTPVDGEEGASVDYSAYSLQPAASPGADGASTVWNFGTAYDLGNGVTTTTPTPIDLNSNDFANNAFRFLIGNTAYSDEIGYGTAVLVADGTVQCDSPPDGVCNKVSSSTPYRLTFIPRGSTFPITAESTNFPVPPVPISAAGHDTATNAIVLPKGNVSSVYDVSQNSPSLVNGSPSTTAFFQCDLAPAPPMQQFRSVWFEYTPPIDTPVFVSTVGSHYDTVLSVVGAPYVLCNDDTDPPAAGEPDGIGRVTSEISFPAVEGTSYQILVTEYPPSPMLLGDYTSNGPLVQDSYIGPLGGDSTLYFTLATPQLIASPAAPSSFAATAVGKTAPAQTFAISSSTGHFGSTGITGVEASASGDFQVSPATCTSPLADSGHACILHVSFTPTAAGTRSGVLTLTSSGSMPAENTPLSIPLSGIGIGKPVITWPPPAAISYGTPLGVSQLNASANVSGTFTYTPASGTVLKAGVNTLSVTFRPTDTKDYTSATTAVPLTVTKATPKISWPTPAPIFYGTALSGEQLDATSLVPGTFLYQPTAGTVLRSGTQMLTVSLRPTDTMDYGYGTATVPLSVVPPKAKLYWTPPAAIPYGTPLSGLQLNASTGPGGPSGTFMYSPGLGTVLNAGVHLLQVTFTPANLNVLSVTTVTVPLTVNKATSAISWPVPSPIVYGTVLSGTQLDATSPFAGTFVYKPVAGTLLRAGAQSLTVTFEPTDKLDFGYGTGSVSLTVQQATPTLSVASSDTHSTHGAKITFTATVSSGVTGMVVFLDDGIQIGTAPISGTTAAYATTSLATGSHSITASWPGNSNYIAVTSSAVAQVVTGP